MGYEPVVIETGLTGGADYLTAVRDLDGRLYVVYFDSTASPNACFLEYSDDDGTTWTAETWSTSIGADTSNGGTLPHAWIDTANNLWVGMSAYDGTSLLTAIKRIENEQRWGVPGKSGEAHQFAVTSYTEPVWFSDSFNRQWGYENFGAVYIHSGDIKFSDLFNANETINATGTCSDPHIAVTMGGIKHAAWIESSGVYWAYLEATSGAFSARSLASDALHTVVSIEDMCIIPHSNNPALLYRHNASGTHQLYLAECADDGSWTQTRIWNGSDNWHHYPGCSLMYDERGSAAVVALYDYNALTRAEVNLYVKRTALGASAWTDTGPLTTGSTNDPTATKTLMCATPAPNGFQPNLLYQGVAFWTMVGTGAADETLYWINHDRYDNDPGVYPTIFSQPAGEPMYRDEPAYSGSTVSLSDEGTSGTTYPLSNSIETYTEQTVFQTSEAVFDAGWKATLLLFPSGRKALDVETVPLSAANKNTLRTFLLSRADDKNPFTFALPDGGGNIDVYCVTESLQVVKVNVGVFKLSFQLQEVL